MADRALPDLKARLLLDTSDLDKGQARVGEVNKSLGLSNQALTTLGHAGLIAGGALLAGFGLAANAAAKFEQQMSTVGAVSGATGGQLDALRDAALSAGAATVFSASQAAEAEAELAKAGVSAADILGGALRGALDLASAGNLNLAQAATIAANAMNTFGLAGKDVPHIADVLAAAANKSAADVDDMGQALAQSGLVANQFGLSLDETSGVLALFAQAGLKGSDAGTSLKTALQRLVPQSAEAAASMKQLGLDFFDAQGNFIGITGAAQELQDGLSGLSQEQRAAALQTIFGADAIRAATLLYQSGGEGVADWTTKVNDSGYAAQLAAEKMDNLSGDLENLKGSIETALIQAGTEGTGVLRDMVQGATNLVNGLGDLPGPLKAVGLGFAGIGGAAVTTLGAMATFIPKIQAARLALSEMGIAGEIASVAIGDIGFAAAASLPGIGAALNLYGKLQADAKAAIDEITRDFQTPKSYADLATQTNTLIAEYDRLNNEASKPFLQEFGQNLNPFADNSIAAAQALRQQLVPVIEAARDATHDWATNVQQASAVLGLSIPEVEHLAQVAGVDLAGGFLGVSFSLRTAQASMLGGTNASNTLAGAIDVLGSATSTAAEQTKAFDDALSALLDTALGGEAAADRLTGDMNNLADAVKTAQENGFDLNTVMTDQSDVALGLRADLRGVTGDALDLVSQWQEAGVTGSELNTRVQWLSASLVDQAVKMGIPREAAQHYIDTLLGIPPTAETTVTADTDIAEQNLERTTGAMDVLDGWEAALSVSANTSAADASIAALAAKINGLTGQFNSIGGGIAVLAGGPAIPFVGVGPAPPPIDDYTGGPKAAGGPVSAGIAYTVGEVGPEVFVPNVAGYIVPHHEVGDWSGSGDMNVDLGGITVNVTGELSAQRAHEIGAEVMDGAWSTLERRRLAFVARTG